MKKIKKICVSFLFLFMLGTFIQSNASVFGTAEWIPTVVTVVCTLNPNEYAHYEGARKACVGWGGLCSGEGSYTITNFDPIHPCPPH